MPLKKLATKAFTMPCPQVYFGLVSWQVLASAQPRMTWVRIMIKTITSTQRQSACASMDSFAEVSSFSVPQSTSTVMPMIRKRLKVLFLKSFPSFAHI